MDKLIVSTPRGQRATDCASFDALRPTLNWEITKDYYEISFSWDRLAASAPEWLPQAIRWTARRRSVAHFRKKNLMAAIYGFVRKRQRCRQIDRRTSGAQWIASRSERKPEAVEVTTPRLYVGNLSFDATESDLFELFNGVGQVQNAEVVSYRHNQRSKGFAFVQMLTIEEAKRAVAELHDKEFLGRKLVVSGAKSSEHYSRN